MLKLGGFGVQHPVRVEQEQSHILLRRMPERVETAGRRIGLAGEPAQEQAVVERESDHTWRISRHAVQRVEPARSQQGARVRQLATAGGTADREFVDVGESGKLVHQRVTGEERRRAPDREIGPGPPPCDEVAGGVGVAAPLAAHCEVEERARSRRRLAEVAGTTRGALFRGRDATEVRNDPRRPDRVVEEQLAQVPLGLGGLEGRVHPSIGKPRLRKVGIVRRNHQLLDSTDLPVDEPAQLLGTVAFVGDGYAREEHYSNGHEDRCACQLPFRFVSHVRVPPRQEPLLGVLPHGPGVTAHGESGDPPNVAAASGLRLESAGMEPIRRGTPFANTRTRCCGSTKKRTGTAGSSFASKGRFSRLGCPGWLPSSRPWSRRRS